MKKNGTDKRKRDADGFRIKWGRGGKINLMVLSKVTIYNIDQKITYCQMTTANNVNENQLIVGKDPSYPYSSDNDNFGSSWSIIVECFYIRPEKLGIVKERL